jgi:hypothetical protein
MSQFSFVGTVECDTCGKPLSDSDETCDRCEASETVVMVFREMNGHDTETAKISLMADHEFLWEKLAMSLDGEDPLKYAWLGSPTQIEVMLGTRNWDTITELPIRATAIDYNGAKDLRDLANYSENDNDE